MKMKLRETLMRLAWLLGWARLQGPVEGDGASLLKFTARHSSSRSSVDERAQRSPRRLRDVRQAARQHPQLLRGVGRAARGIIARSIFT